MEITMKAAPTVTDVGTSGDWMEYSEDERLDYLYVYVDTVGGSVELKLSRDDDIDQWIDDTGCRWTPEARATLAQLLPRTAPLMVAEIPTGDIGLDRQRDLVIPALLGANFPPTLFRRGTYVTEIARDEKYVPVMRTVTNVRMRERVQEVTKWHNAKEVEVHPPYDVCATLLETPKLELPPLVAVVEHPVLGPDGQVAIRRGYNQATGYYFAPSQPLTGVGLTDEDGYGPDEVDVRLALSWLNELLEDFEFVDRADKANVLAMMLTPILRPIIDGPVPLAAVRAVKAGTGKSLLVKAALTMLAGREPEATSLGKDEDEAEKRLMSLFLDGRQIVFLDNVKTGTVLESAALARALTTDRWTGRIIQSSKAPVLPVRCLWVATGNNLTMSDELARRSYLIELTSTVERPNLRPESDFRHGDLMAWVKENRGALLTSLLVLAQTWADDGMETTPGPSLSSFEKWSHVVGSVLRHAGETNFLANESRKRDIVEDGANLERENLLVRMAEHMGTDVDFTVRDFHEKTRLIPDVVQVTIPFLGATVWGDERAPTELGYAVRTFAGAPYGGFKLVKGPKSKFGVRYRVLDVSWDERDTSPADGDDGDDV